MKEKLIALLITASLLLTGCQSNIPNNTDDGNFTENAGIFDPSDTDGSSDNPDTSEPGEAADLGGDDKTFGDDIDSTGAYDGYFEGESKEITVEWISGTKNAYKLEGDTLYFTEVTEDTVYALSGTFSGNIVTDTGDDFKFDLELHGFSLISNTVNPITVLSGSEVSVKAKKDTNNYIYDMREAIDETDDSLYSGSIHSEVDLEISGKGSLTVVSENNNGIHSKDDLQVKNLTLFTACIDNALKGNDSVEITEANTTLIASAGDGIKTSSSDISSKGNQRGIISVSGGTHTIYAACDGIDASYDVIIDGDTTVLNIYTDKYSSYSTEVTATASDEYYIRFSSKSYKYSVKFIDSADGKYEWVNAEYHSQASGGRSVYYYYAFPKLEGYDKLQFFVYTSDMTSQQESEYAAASDEMALNTSYDTIALTNTSYSWTNYSTTVREGGFGGFGRPGGGPGGMGGMGDGNTDKGNYSTKGIKAANEIVINSGNISIKSYDDAIHANKDTELENGNVPLGNVTVNGGNVTVYSNDDGLHADGTLNIKSGTVTVTNSYEGIEGSIVNIAGGFVTVSSKDDGVNATSTSGTSIEISGGTVYISCTGDGIDSNSRASYSGIVFSGGNTVVISNSGGNSAIDSEQGYSYTGGSVIALMPRGGMSNEAVHCKDFSSVGAYDQISLNSGDLLEVVIDKTTATVKMPFSMTALVIVLGDKDAKITSKSSSSAILDSNGVSWSNGASMQI